MNECWLLHPLTSRADVTLLSWGPDGRGGSRAPQGAAGSGKPPFWPQKLEGESSCSYSHGCDGTGGGCSPQLFLCRLLCYGLNKRRFSIRTSLGLLLSFFHCRISPFSSPAGQGSPAAVQARGSLPPLCSTCSCWQPESLETSHRLPSAIPVSASSLAWDSPRLKAELQDDCGDGSATVRFGEINSRIECLRSTSANRPF